MSSEAQALALLPTEQQTEYLDALTIEEAQALMFDWGFWQRPNQATPKGAWAVWMILAGRGYGKTRTGAEWAREQAEKRGPDGRIALVSQTPATARRVMIEGESGILAKSPPWFRPIYEPSKRQLAWPNGCIGTVYTSHNYEELRGEQHTDAWCDEMAAWMYLQDTWDMLQFGCRLGHDPRICITTTPKPLKLIRELIGRDNTVKTTGSTYENLHNLAPTFKDAILSRYEGTTLGRQEIYAELLDEVEGALWLRKWILRRELPKNDMGKPDLQRIVVGVDPATTNNPDSDETGIIASGLDFKQHGHVLADSSGRYTPDGWARAAVGLYHDLNADCIIAESNQGGEMVAHTIRTIDRNAPVRLVHAKRSKQARAEPVAALYEQGRISHADDFGALEGELISWIPETGDESPNRLDAMVYTFHELMLAKRNVSERKLSGV
jgi:phage terminase large subunit-like protein